MPTFMDLITKLESPIDVMYLMHKVFMAHSERTEALAQRAQDGGNLTEFKASLDVLLKHLFYHVGTEDTYMTGPLRERQFQDGRMPLKENKQEHEDLREKGGDALSFVNVTETDLSPETILDLDDEEHAKFQKTVDELEFMANKALQEERAIARTRRHLYRSVMALRVAEFDHFENEEAFVLPLVKEQMSPSEELECSRRLLIDDDSDNPRWVIDFVHSELSDGEKLLLEDLETKFSKANML